MTESWTPDEDAAFLTAAGNGHVDPSQITSWWPVDLSQIIAGIKAGRVVGPVPKLLQRTDGVALLYPAEVHSLAGEPETGKGWIALTAAAQVIADGGHVLYLDCEDAPASIVTRLLALQVPADHIIERFAYVRPVDPPHAGTLDALLGRTYQLAVIDGLSEAYALLGLDPYSNTDAAEFLAKLCRPIATTGAAVLLIDHVIKNKESRGRYALGAQHKLAGIATAYTTDAIAIPSRKDAGLIKVRVEKDRHGHVRPHADGKQIALARITPTNDGAHVTVTLDPPDQPTTSTGEFRPTILMGRIWEYVEANPGATRNTIQREVKGTSNDYKDQALRLLITEGYIKCVDGARNARLHHVANPWPPTEPDRAPTEPEAQSTTEPDRAPPLKGSVARPGHHRPTTEPDNT